MMRMRKHIYRLNFCYLVFLVQDVKVAGLGCCITADVYHQWLFHVKYFFNQLFVHAGPRRVGNDDVRFSMRSKKVVITYF